MKKSIRVFAALLAITTLCTSAYATSIGNKNNSDDYSIRSSDYISSYSALITAQSGGVIAIDCLITGTGTMNVIGVKTLKMQKYQSGSWTTVRTFSSLYEYYSMQASVYATYQGTAGNQYRAVITFYASDSSGYDTRILTTNSVTAVS
jgi:hypothetical protein